MGDNPHPTGYDVISDREIEKAACASWPLVNPDDHWSSPANSVTKNRHVEVVRAVALSLPTPKGKHIEDVYPDEAVAWVKSDGKGTITLAWIPDMAATAGEQPLYTAVQLLAARQQGIAEERERCAGIAAEHAKANWGGPGDGTAALKKTAASIEYFIRGAS